MTYHITNIPLSEAKTKIQNQINDAKKIREKMSLFHRNNTFVSERIAIDVNAWIKHTISVLSDIFPNNEHATEFREAGIDVPKVRFDIKEILEKTLEPKTQCLYSKLEFIDKCTYDELKQYGPKLLSDGGSEQKKFSWIEKLKSVSTSTWLTFLGILVGTVVPTYFGAYSIGYNSAKDTYEKDNSNLEKHVGELKQENITLREKNHALEDSLIKSNIVIQRLQSVKLTDSPKPQTPSNHTAN